MNPREMAKQDGEELGRRAFDRGVSAVLAAVFGNRPVGECGLTTGGCLNDEDLEAVRWLRQKVHGRKAYDYKPNRQRPPRNATRGLRHKARAAQGEGR